MGMDSDIELAVRADSHEQLASALCTCWKDRECGGALAVSVSTFMAL